MKKLILPADVQALADFHAGETVLVSGTLYTARDAGHKRMVESLNRGEVLPFPIENAAIYYVGPCPAPQGYALGSCGPTTSTRMDDYAPRLMEEGLRVMIGKGPRKPEVIRAMQATGSLYLGATGGAGALLASRVKESRILAYEDLGTEALRELQVEDMPLTVLIDSQGRSVFEEGPAAYRDDASIHIRPAQLHEEAEVWSFYHETVSQMNRAGNFLWYEGYPTRDIIDRDLAEGSMDVLEKDGRIIAACVLNHRGDPAYSKVEFSVKKEPVLYLHRMAVLPSLQRQGYGRMLLSHQQKKARETGAAAIRLDTYIHNESGLRLYEHAGFQRCGRVVLDENAPQRWEFYVMEWDSQR